MKSAPVACAVLLLSITASAQSRDPVAGPWELIASKNLDTNAPNDVPAPALHVVFANGHYVQFTAASDRKVIAKPTEELTRDELVDRLRMQGQYGTYEVKGTQLIRKVIAAAFPPNTGTQQVMEFKVEGDTLITAGSNAQGIKTENRYRKLK